MIILVTGGTGTLGRAMLPKLMDSFKPSRIRVLSRDEHKQTAMGECLGHLPIDWFIGDVRDEERVWYAAKGADVVFHLAAVKSVDKAEYNPNEAIETNIKGSRNVINACIKHNVQRAIITSTDKACEPLNVYGATKLVAEKLFVNSNSYSGANGPIFGAVRYGNVLGSNGSVLQKWRSCIDNNTQCQITEPNMSRFWITKERAADFVINSLKNMGRGEVRIPKMKACFMQELYKAFSEAVGNEKPYRHVGVRPGEKMDERLFGVEETHLLTDVVDLWIKWPSNPSYPVKTYGHKVEEAFSSRMATHFRHDELTRMIKEALCIS